MSPEQAQGIKSVDHRSDLWSLAVIAFQALTGQLPFQSEALGDLLVKIIVGEIPTPSAFSHEVPLQFDGWWKKAASRNPNDRFQSAKEFADSLSLAIGVSGVTDVMDMRAVQAAIARGGHGRMPPTGTALLGPGETPEVPVPHGSTPHPFGMTPQSAMARSVDAPGGMSGSQPGYGPPPGAMHGAMQGGGPGFAAAGAPPSTFNGVEQAPVPKKSSAAVFAIVGAAALLVGLVGVGALVMVMRGHSSEAAASGGAPTASMVATTTAVPTVAPTTTATATTTAEATASASASATAPAASAATAANGTDLRVDRKGDGTPTTHHHGSSTTTTAGSAKPAQGKNAVDQFGF